MTNDQRTLWILGAGKFGQRAAKTLRKAHPDAEITVIDRNINTLNRLKNLATRTICGDGIAFLTENLKSADDPKWLIPTIPVHVAYEWIRCRLKNAYRLEPLTIPKALMDMLWHPVVGRCNEIYMSIADFLCPDDCPSPKDVCTFTGEPRPLVLHEFLASLHYQDFQSIVIESKQLAPGVGGYTPKALLAALAEVKKSRYPILFSTASRCHGVMHAFEIFLR